MLLNTPIDCYRHDYKAVLWTRADSREALVSGYVSIAYLLDLPQKDEQDQALVVQSVLHRLSIHPALISLQYPDFGITKSYLYFA